MRAAVREIEVTYRPASGACPKVADPKTAARLLWPMVEGEARERFYALLLDTRNRLLGVRLVSVGTLDGSLVGPREVFGPALKANAASIIVAHNHPSGDPTPSRADREVTRRLVKAGELLGVRVLDHVVLGSEGRFTSLAATGDMRA